MRYPGTRSVIVGGHRAGARMLAFAQGLLRLLRRVVEVVVVALLCAMILLIMAQILGRYVLNYSIAWSEEVAIFAQIWLVMLGAGLAMRRRQHVGIDVLIVYFPASVQRVAKAASFLLILWFLGVIIFGSFGLIAIGLVLKSPALQIPMAVPYFALPIGMFYFLVEFAIATLPEIRDPASAGDAVATGPE